MEEDVSSSNVSPKSSLATDLQRLTRLKKSILKAVPKSIRNRPRADPPTDPEISESMALTTRGILNRMRLVVGVEPEPEPDPEPAPPSESGCAVSIPPPAHHFRVLTRSFNRWRSLSKRVAQMSRSCQILQSQRRLNLTERLFCRWREKSTTSSLAAAASTAPSPTFPPPARSKSQDVDIASRSRPRDISTLRRAFRAWGSLRRERQLNAREFRSGWNRKHQRDLFRVWRMRARRRVYLKLRVLKKWRLFVRTRQAVLGERVARHRRRWDGLRLRQVLRSWRELACEAIATRKRSIGVGVDVVLQRRKRKWFFRWRERAGEVLRHRNEMMQLAIQLDSKRRRQKTLRRWRKQVGVAEILTFAHSRRSERTLRRCLRTLRAYSRHRQKMRQLNMTAYACRSLQLLTRTFRKWRDTAQSHRVATSHRARRLLVLSFRALRSYVPYRREKKALLDSAVISMRQQLDARIRHRAFSSWRVLVSRRRATRAWGRQVRLNMQALILRRRFRVWRAAACVKKKWGNFQKRQLLRVWRRRVEEEKELTDRGREAERWGRRRVQRSVLQQLRAWVRRKREKRVLLEEARQRREAMLRRLGVSDWVTAAGNRRCARLEPESVESVESGGMGSAVNPAVAADRAAVHWEYLTLKAQRDQKKRQMSATERFRRMMGVGIRERERERKKESEVRSETQLLRPVVRVSSAAASTLATAPTRDRSPPRRPFLDSLRSKLGLSSSHSPGIVPPPSAATTGLSLLPRSDPAFSSSSSSSSFLSQQRQQRQKQQQQRDLHTDLLDRPSSLLSRLAKLDRIKASISAIERSLHHYEQLRETYLEEKRLRGSVKRQLDLLKRLKCPEASLEVVRCRRRLEEMEGRAREFLGVVRGREVPVLRKVLARRVEEYARLVKRGEEDENKEEEGESE